MKGDSLYLRFGFILVVLCLFLAPGCGKNNLGDLFPPYYSAGDPADLGFDGPDGNGAYTLYGLEAGTIFGNDPPALAGTYPANGAADVDLGALVALRFTKSLRNSTSMLDQAVKVQKSAGGDSVAGDWSFAPGSAHRVIVFEPDDPLEEKTAYEVHISASLSDAQGMNYAAKAAATAFSTGDAGGDIPFAVADGIVLPPPSSSTASERAPVLILFTEAVDTSGGVNGLGEGGPNFEISDQDGGLIDGDHEFHYDNRLFVFDPEMNMPAGKRIDVTVKKEAGNSLGSETLDSDFDFSFDIVAFPRITSIVFNDVGDPFVALPARVYSGSIVEPNLHTVEITVTLEGSGQSDRLTLILWDNDSKAIILSDEANRSAGTMTYFVDVQPKAGEAIKDGTVTVGAFTTSRSGTNSPVGPPEVLPDLCKDLVDPLLVSLGPPYGSSAGSSELLLEEPGAGLHGRASEDLKSIQVTLDVNGTPQTVDGIVFFSMEFPAGTGLYSNEVTRGGGNLFITEPITGIDLDLVRDGAPFRVTEITLVDLVGNTTTLVDPTDATVDYVGFVGVIPFPAANEIEIFCYDAVTLHPVADADVIIDRHSSDYSTHDPADRLGSHTGSDGTAVFPLVSHFPGDYITVTLIRDGYELTSLVGLDKPTGGSGAFLSLPLYPEDAASGQANVTVAIAEINGDTLDHVYFGGNVLEMDNGTLYYAGEDPSTALVTTQRNTLQFLQAMGVETASPEDRYHWAWSNPYLGDSGSSVQSVLFTEAVQGTADLPIQPLLVKDPDYTELQARLVARLNGFCGTLPLAVDLGGIAAGDDVDFVVPLPPSLFVNESLVDVTDSAAIDPPYELVIEPALGPVQNLAAPSETLLEEALRFEVEEKEVGTDPHIVAVRLPYAGGNIETKLDVEFPSNGGSSVILDVVFGDTAHPPEVSWTPVHELTGMAGTYRLRYFTTSGTRHWNALVPSGAYSGTKVRFPDLAALPAGFTALNSLVDFSDPGDYSVSAEAFELAGFDLNAAFLSAVARDWVSYYKSGTVQVISTSP